MPPAKPQFDKLTRNILASKPRVTRFKINWDDSNGATNGDMNDEASGSAEFAANHDKNEQSMDQDDNDMENVNGSGPIAVDARLNENSNSLAMEC